MSWFISDIIPDQNYYFSFTNQPYFISFENFFLFSILSLYILKYIYFFTKNKLYIVLLYIAIIIICYHADTILFFIHDYYSTVLKLKYIYFLIIFDFLVNKQIFVHYNFTLFLKNFLYLLNFLQQILKYLVFKFNLIFFFIK